MTATDVNYAMTILTSQPLGTSPQIKVTIPLGITIDSLPSCSVTISLGILSSYNCLFDSSTRNLTVNLTTQSNLTTNTNISITL